MVTEMVQCGASPLVVQAVLQCAQSVESHKLCTLTLYQDTLRQALQAAAQNVARASGGVDSEWPPVEQPQDRVELILTSVSQHEAGG